MGSHQTSSTKLTLKEKLARRARELGFDQCRITATDAIGKPGAPNSASVRLDRWLADGAHGDMGWMETTRARRSDPRTLWSDTRSIIMLGLNYGPAVDPLLTLEKKTQANISVYARNRDYHDIIKGRLKMLSQWLVAQPAVRNQSQNPQIKVFVDTAPVMEKPLAAAAGIGWQGKHTNLVSQEFGSWLFLGAIFTNLELEEDAALTDHCGTCQSCLDICPTNAFPAPYRLDARRCISYLTTEHKGHIDPSLRKAMGNRVYGCDDCLAVCPWNKFAQAASESKLVARQDLEEPALAQLLALDDPGFRQMFSGSPVKRIGHIRFLRNLLIAAGNSEDRTLLSLIIARMDHEDPLVRAMAVWAAGQLEPAQQLETLAWQKQRNETDSAVLSEWQAALEQKTLES